ncbi:hypothetical protein ACT453_60310, partial [Bacillus sp. D-CC]
RFGNKQVTEVPLEVVYGDSIAYVGYDNDIASIVTLKHDDKKFHATDMDSQIHKPLLMVLLLLAYFQNDLSFLLLLF